MAVEIKVEPRGPGIFVWGELTPAVANVPITIEITNERGGTLLLYTTSNASGTFYARTDPQLQRLDPGRYTVQGFANAGATAAEAESAIVTVTVHS